MNLADPSRHPARLLAAAALVLGLACCAAERHALEAGTVASSGSDTTLTQPESPCRPDMPLSGDTDTDAGPGSLPPAVEQTFVICVRTTWDARGPLTVTYVQTTHGQATPFADPTIPEASEPVFVLFLKGPFNLLNPGGVRLGGGGSSPPTSVYGVIGVDGHPILIASWGSAEDYDLSKLGTPQSTVIDFG